MIRAILFDRDGTLIVDRPDRGQDIVPMPNARQALLRARHYGFRIGVVTNQPDKHAGEVLAIHQRIESELGPIDGWFVCTHAVSDRCACRKPQAGLIVQAARAFGIAPDECAVIGDIGSDVDAAHAAGAHAVLVPTPVTLRDEIERAPIVCTDLLQAVEHVAGAFALP
jgi:histidinol-phosphate phosphatase family protein